MASAPPISEWPVGQICTNANFSSLLQQGWCWFSFNKEPIGSIVQVLGVAGIVFAARSFFRTQQLNQANAVFQLMKEGRDLLLKVDPPIAGSAANKKRSLSLGMNFHASMFQYRHLKFVDETTWKPFEDDLEDHMRDQDFVNWLYGRANEMGLPAAEKFDPRFISYLKTIHQRVPSAKARSQGNLK
jgi:hypothetical protein